MVNFTLCIFCHNTKCLFKKKKRKKLVMDLENRLMVAWGKGEGGGKDWESGVNGCKLLLMEWIYNEILLCSTENYV